MPARYPIDRWTRRKALALRATLVVSLAVAAPVISGTTMSLTDTVTSTGISGFAGTAFTFGDPEGMHSVYWLWSVERNDKPAISQQ